MEILGTFLLLVIACSHLFWFVGAAPRFISWPNGKNPIYKKVKETAEFIWRFDLDGSKYNFGVLKRRGVTVGQLGPGTGPGSIIDGALNSRSSLTASDRSSNPIRITYTLNNIVRSDDSEYDFEVFTSINVIGSAQLVVVVPPTITYTNLPGPGITVTENGKQTLKCAADGNPKPTIEWFRDNALVETNKNVTLDPIKRQDAGNYRCTAIIMADQRYVESFTIEVIVWYKPTNVNLTTEKPGNAVVKVTSVTLVCISDGYPEPTYTFKKGDTVLASDSSSKTYTFPGTIALSDEGYYTCSPKNSKGYGPIATMKLTLQVKPVVITDIVEAIKTENENFTYTCIATGKPAPDITWFKDGTKISQSSIYDIQQTIGAASIPKLFKSQGDLMMTSLTWRQDGNYICLASNPAGNAISAAQLTVRHAEPHQATPQGNDPNPLSIYIGAAAGGVGLVIALLVLVWFMMRRQRVNTGENVAERTTEEFTNGVNRISDNYSMTICPHYDNEAIDTASDNIPEDVIYHEIEFYVNAQAIAENTPYEWEYPSERLHVKGVIGKGAFCQVAKGYSDDLGVVAVKMLKANSPDSHRRDLLSEIKLMKELEPHPNVVRLLGVITRSEPIMAIVEYIPYGDLLGYLRRSRGLSDNYYRNPDYKPKTSLTPEQLLKFAKQTADGMAFLSKNKIIHRDLAARNVLVGIGETCKIADFGMARDIQGEDFYQKRTQGRLPVKWTAYEALCYGYYTTQSDVWSFGIVLYEIFTIGGCPYPNMDGRKLASVLQEGYRMEKPVHVDNDLYQMMCECWIMEPERRPSFDALSKTLARLQGSHKPILMMSKYNGKIYANDLC